MNNREKMIDLMIDNSLDRRELAKLLSVDRPTLDAWLAPGEASRHEAVPDMAIDLLTLKLASNRADGN